MNALSHHMNKMVLTPQKLKHFLLAPGYCNDTTLSVEEPETPDYLPPSGSGERNF